MQREGDVVMNRRRSVRTIEIGTKKYNTKHESKKEKALVLFCFASFSYFGFDLTLTLIQ